MFAAIKVVIDPENMGITYTKIILCSSLVYLFTTAAVNRLITDQNSTEVVTVPSQKKQNLALNMQCIDGWGPNPTYLD